MTAPLILAADIGGTNTRLALCDGHICRTDTILKYANADVTHLNDHLKRYLSDTGAPLPDAVALALAGPVSGDKGKLTNLDWDIDTEGSSQAVGCAKAVLLNDLQAQGHAIPYLTKDHIETHLTGLAAPRSASCLVIGLGTGLNIAPVHFVAGQTFVPPAEAGHVTFGSTSPALHAYEKSLTDRFGHTAAEDILSGRGIERAYKHVTGNEESAANVMKACNAGDPEAREAITLMVRALGEFAGDMALSHLPTGGIFLVGGVSRALGPHLDALGFLDGFTAKGRFGEFMQQFPIHIVHDDYAALTGAASYAEQVLAKP